MWKNHQKLQIMLNHFWNLLLRMSQAANMQKHHCTYWQLRECECCGSLTRRQFWMTWEWIFPWNTVFTLPRHMLKSSAENKKVSTPGGVHWLNPIDRGTSTCIYIYSSIVCVPRRIMELNTATASATLFYTLCCMPNTVYKLSNVYEFFSFIFNSDRQFAAIHNDLFWTINCLNYLLSVAGVYSWIGVNYVLGRFNHSHTGNSSGCILHFMPCLEKYSQSEPRIAVAYSAVCNVTFLRTDSTQPSRRE